MQNSPKLSTEGCKCRSERRPPVLTISIMCADTAKNGTLWPKGFNSYLITLPSFISLHEPSAAVCSWLSAKLHRGCQKEPKLWAALWYAELSNFITASFFNIEKPQHSGMSPRISNVCPQGGFLRWRQPQGMFKASGSCREGGASTNTASAVTLVLPLTAVVRVGKNHSFMRRFLLAIAWQSVFRV